MARWTISTTGRSTSPSPPTSHGDGRPRLAADLRRRRLPARGPPQADGQDVDHVVTFLIRLPDPQPAPAAPPLRVVPLIGLRAPVALRPDGTSIPEPADIARLAAVQTVLDRHPTAPAAVDLRPETLAAVRHRELHTLNDGSLQAALAGRAVVAPTYVDVDADRWVAAGPARRLQRQRILATDALTQIPPPGFTIDSGTWIARRPLSSSTQAVLADLGITRMVLPAGDVAAVDNRAVAPAETADAALRPFDVEQPHGRTVLLRRPTSCSTTGSTPPVMRCAMRRPRWPI